MLALALIGGALWLINATFQPFHDEPTGAVSVTVPSGSDAGRIGKILESAGVIDSARLFEANATVTMRRGKLRPGKYQLPLGMSNGAAIEALMQGPQAKVVKTFKFTLPEGRSRRENIPAVDKAFEGDYGKATTNARYLRRARKLGAPRSARSLEGFLFPATYQMINGASASDLVERQLDAFRENFATVNMKTARRRNLTRYDVLIIASMVEREAQLPKERPLIAAVMHNRLKQGIPLGIDATIRYQINNWSRPLRVSELERDTPYNTRTRRGLPPTPIGNPGPRLDQGRREPGQGQVPVLRAQAGQVRRARLLQHQQPVRARRRALPGLARRTVIYLGVCGWPVAHSRSPAMHNAALRATGLDGWEYLALPLPPPLFTETVRALPAAGLPRRQRDDPAQAGRARARRLRQPGRAGDRRRQHADVRARRRHRSPTTPTRRGCWRRCATGGSTSRDAPRSSSARAGRPAPRSGRSSAPARASRSGTARPRAPPRSRTSSARGTPGPRAGGDRRQRDQPGA